MFQRIGLALALALFLVSSTAAQTPIWPEGQPRVAKWRAFNAFGVGFNPIVFGDYLKIYRAIPITSGSHMLTRDSHIRLGGSTVVSPEMAKIGPFVGISPLLICDFDVTWNQYFEFYSRQFDSIHDSYDAHTLRAKDTSFQSGQNVIFSSVLKFAYAGVIVVNLFDIEYFYFQDTWFPIELYTIIDDGWDHYNKTFLLYEYAPGWRIGTMFETFHVINSGLNRHSLNFGFMADRKLPLDMTWVFLTGIHVDNPDFDGLRLWTAILKEWDL